MSERELLSGLAELLSYPGERTAQVATRVGAPAFFRQASLVELQETYTSTFDLQPACAPYVGHHLLGEETGLRGAFLAKLVEVYRDAGYAPRVELADHVAEVLGYLAVAAPCAHRDDLVRDGLLPALRKMIEAFEGGDHPYRQLLALVEQTVRAEIAVAPSQRSAVTERRAAP